MTQITSMEELFKTIWSDPAFKQEFISNPKATLSQVGVTVADNVELTVLEETENNLFLVIPSTEATQEISEDSDPIAKLIARVATDAALRAEMLADPKAVILRETGLVIPEESEVTVFEQTADKAYLVLPRHSEDGERELSTAELETVAAGSVFPGPFFFFTKIRCLRTIIFCRR
ncbi:MAG: hypothetical protein CV045_08310 [Cyanobacteria bacterium M5B4]|nr:MAG: hypothetical protein CV045_08310 [Cyanobacteria bacterium M5B4]